MFESVALRVTLPASDLARAKSWYADKLGLIPAEESIDEGAVWYETGGLRFLLYQSAFAGTNQATAATFTVDDVASVVAELKGRGVTFEEYDMGEIKTEDGILTLPDGNQGAWFKDSEGNIIAVNSM